MRKLLTDKISQVSNKWESTCVVHLESGYGSNYDGLNINMNIDPDYFDEVFGDFLTQYSEEVGEWDE